MTAKPRWLADVERGPIARKPSRRYAVYLLCVSLTSVVLFLVHAGLTGRYDYLPSASTLGLATPAEVDPCATFDPHADAASDPPGCLRARQWRQIQHFRNISEADNRYQDDIIKPSIDYLERCALGLVQCPPRPLIVTEWWYIRRMDSLSARGETVWMGPIIDALEDHGYTLARFSHYDSRGRVWRFLSLMSESLHMYWPGEAGSFECLNHPRCVRPDDYTPHPNASHAYDVASIPKEQLGTVPAFRVFSLSFWGSRPDNYNGMQIYAKREWGMQDGEDEWAWHVLGQKFQITPYAYPGHTQIPITIEKACLESPYLAYDKRDKAVAILGKKPKYFKKFQDGLWPKIIQGAKDMGVELWSFAHVEKEEGKALLPAGLTQIGELPRYEYGHKAASARALLAIGDPQISPTPYGSLCRGVPVVLPYYGDSATPEGWKLFAAQHAQHGPANQIGEPYVYTYKFDDAADLVAKMKKAYETPIEPYIPPEMTAAAVVARVKEVLEHDWEGEYESVKQQFAGHIPAYNPRMMEFCRAWKTCQPLTNEMRDDYYLPGEAIPKRAETSDKPKA